ncbi:MAG: SAM-dependent methyltransferase [Natronomonas sp.]|uniref:class I SAM-dependent methyltransferase n=1 Tax=Natronomonas sp. TaxID=2184060 RepID=UPI0039891E84
MDSNQVRRQWADRSGEYSPTYYAHHGPDDRSESVRSAIDRFLGRDAAILELGCSSGRHLAHLHDDGFENLTGIELNEEAFEVMDETYPDLAETGTFHHAAIENVIKSFDDGQFDAVYSVETLQHLHPDVEWVFAEIARITDDVLVTVENEGGDDADSDDGVNYVNGEFPLYYRDWNGVFTDLGFEAVDAEEGKRDIVRTFRAGTTQ